MIKWNKYDSRFIVKSILISGFALLIWSFFIQFQINENYLDFPINEKEAKQKALQYIGSRGWDVSGYTYASDYSHSSWKTSWNHKYFSEIPAQKNKDEIDKIDKLGGNHRWNMRWFRPPDTDEIAISYTKDGQLIFFNHIIPDTLAGDSLPQEIAYNVAKIFLKNMPFSDFVEKDWIITEKTQSNKPNRIDHYFQWENNKYNLDNSTIRISLRVHGSQVVRFHRWFEESEELKTQFISWGIISDFFDNIFETILLFTIVCAILIALFYFKIPGNWMLGTKIALFLVFISISKGILEIPTEMMGFDSEDTLIASIFGNLINLVLQATFTGFIVMVVVAATDKLYRSTFPNFISVSNLFNLRGFSSKIYFNNYLIGIVAGICTLSLESLFYYCIDQSSNYIAYKYLDYNILLSLQPLLIIIIDAIRECWMFIVPFTALSLILYRGIKSKWLTILIAALLSSITSIIDTDPVYIGSIFFFIMSIIYGFLLFRHGLLTLISFVISKYLLSIVVLLFFTHEIYNIITGIIIIFLLLFPLFYSILHYLKFQTTTKVDHLLNSTEVPSEIKTSQPLIPKVELIHNNKWAFGLFIIGLFCLIIPNNDELKDIWQYQTNRSNAISSAKDIIENEYDADLSDYKISTNNFDEFGWNSWTNSMPPFQFYLNKRSSDFAYLKEKIGRQGILELAEEHGKVFMPWDVKFYQPDSREYYEIKIDPISNKAGIKFYHAMSDDLEIPSLSQSEVGDIVTNHLNKQNINIETLKVIEAKENVEVARVDHEIEYERPITLSNDKILNERLFISISGNTISKWEKEFYQPEDWKRKYSAYHPLFFLCTWGSLLIWVISMIIGMYYLIENTFKDKYEISWKMIIYFISFLGIICITNFINYFPVIVTDYSGYQSWLAFLLQKIGWYLNNIGGLLLQIIIPVCALYFINPIIKNIFSSSSRKSLGHGALISSLATLGAILLYRPVKYILYENFPSYIDMSDWFNMNILSAYLPGYALVLQFIINMLWISMVSLFFYQKFMEFKLDGKIFKQFLILSGAILLYLIYGSFIEQPVAMIPHFLSRIFGVTCYLLLIKYFWKNNPLSHLFGTFIYFYFYTILRFIHIADPTLKIQGWIIIGLFALLFIYSVGLKSIRNGFSSQTV